MPSLSVPSLSVLDQSPIPSGCDASEALANSLELARLTERLGYRRYWVAEHHGTSGLAGSAPEVLIAHLAALTSSIRVGSGGVMLPHYSPYKVAEQFRVLAALHPGRIDLGLGRAPGGTPRSTHALRRLRDRPMPDDFPEQMVELLTWLEGGFDKPHPFHGLEATPLARSGPEPWLLSSSGYGAVAAAQLGTYLCYADFINPAGGSEAIARYRNEFVPSRLRPEPRVTLAVSVICAPTDREAAELAMPVALWRRRLRRWGDPGPVPSLEEALADSPGGFQDDFAAADRRRLVVGGPDRVADALDALAKEHDVDEIMVVTITHDHAARLRSYQLIAEALGSVPPRGSGGSMPPATVRPGGGGT